MSVGRLTMAEKNSQSVPIKGLTGKRNSTLTFMFCLAGEFWRCKLRYQDKTKAGLSRNSIFRKGCCLAQNQTHYSNEGVTLKLTDSIFNPQLVQQQQQQQQSLLYSYFPKSVTKQKEIKNKIRVLAAWNNNKGQRCQAAS